MKKILLTILSLSFLSCQTRNDFIVSVQCSNQFSYIDENTIDVKSSVCRCRDYKFSEDFIGPVSGVYLKEFNYCNNLVGFPIKEYPTVQAFWEAVRQSANER